MVDDNPGDQRFIEEAIRASQMDVTIHTMDTKDEGLDVVHQRGECEDGPDPDAILLDWNLAQTTSEEVLIVAKNRQSPIPVVVMTGSTPEMNGLQAACSQADMVIEKPTSPDGYIETLRTLQTKHKHVR